MARRRPPTVALCGAGMISGAHATAAALAGLPVVAVASRSSVRASEVAARVGGRAVPYGELPAGADIVVVATPPGQHAADALRLLECGAAVVLEKPLCTTLAEADALVAAADHHRQRLLYAENLAYAPVVQEFVRRAMAVRPLRHLEVRAVGALPTWGDHTSDSWGGGVLFDLGVHPLAVALLAAAPARPVEVRAELRGSATGAHGSDEHAEMTIWFDSGWSAQVVASWQGGPTPVWDAQAAGDTAVVRAELLPVPALEVNGEPVAFAPVRSTPPAIEQYGYRGQLTAFAADLAAGRRPLMDAAFGRLVLDLVCAGYQSAGRGTAVRVPFVGPRHLTPLQLWRAG